MALTLDRWSRVGRAADALTAAKLFFVALAAFIWRASPRYALVVVLALPPVAALGLLILRWLREALTGRRVRFWPLDHEHRTIPERLGRPSWERMPNARASATGLTGLRSTPLKFRARASSGRGR